jgi:hypothetical protein
MAHAREIARNAAGFQPRSEMTTRHLPEYFPCGWLLAAALVAFTMLVTLVLALVLKRGGVADL